MTNGAMTLKATCTGCGSTNVNTRPQVRAADSLYFPNCTQLMTTCWDCGLVKAA